MRGEYYNPENEYPFGKKQSPESLFEKELTSPEKKDLLKISNGKGAYRCEPTKVSQKPLAKVQQDAFEYQISVLKQKVEELEKNLKAAKDQVLVDRKTFITQIEQLEAKNNRLVEATAEARDYKERCEALLASMKKEVDGLNETITNKNTLISSLLERLNSETTNADDIEEKPEEPTNDSDSDADKNQVYDYLNKHVPYWEAQNTDDAFLEWLQQKDPTYGFVRHDVMTDAFNRLDTEVVANFFLEFRRVRAESL